MGGVAGVRGTPLAAVGCAMRFAVNMPNFGDFGDPHTVVALGREAEAAGWDGLFLWDHINVFRSMPIPLVDPWVTLAAVATATQRLLIGTMVTPVPRRRPWDLARQTATLDRLCGGRLILGVGLGLPADTEFEAFGEDADLKVRAEKLDEGLEVLAGLWSGEPFAFHGKHYQVGQTRFCPTPVQWPRIPVYVAGSWPKAGPMRRAARWDGYFPLKLDASDEGAAITPEEIAEIRGRLEELREGRPAEIVIADEVTDLAPRDLERMRAFAAAGATWHHETLSTRHLPIEAMFERIRQGPPRL